MVLQSQGRFLQTDTYVIDPIETPGLIHAENLTEESAKTTEELLKHNNENYHIFFTMEDHMGVSSSLSSPVKRKVLLLKVTNC